MATTFIPWAGQVPYGSDMIDPKKTPFGPSAMNNNQFMAGQSILPFMMNLPGYQENVGQRANNTGAMLKGEVPQDVVNLLAQQSAERGVGAGVQGSPNSSTALLRALGLTSLDMMNQGSQQLSQSISDTPTPELFNPASLWAPEYTAKSELGQLQAGQARQKLEASNKAAADAWNKKKLESGTGWQQFNSRW